MANDAAYMDGRQEIAEQFNAETLNLTKKQEWDPEALDDIVTEFANW